MTNAKLMTDEEAIEFYKSLSKLAQDKNAEEFLFSIGNFLALLAYDHNVPLMSMLAKLNTSALFNYEELVRREDESTKH